MKDGDIVILTGDNFNVPNVGMKGVVAKIGFHGYVKVTWPDGKSGIFTSYQADTWLVICREGEHRVGFT